MGTPPDRDPEQGGGWEPSGWRSEWQQPQSGQSRQQPGPEQPQPQQAWQAQAPVKHGGWQQAPDGSWVQVAGSRSSGKSTAALVMGILGLVFCPLICSVLALVFGYQARREIDASGGRMGGRGNATAGIVLGWIGIAIMIALVVLLGIGFAVGGEAEISTPSEPSSLS